MLSSSQAKSGPPRSGADPRELDVSELVAKGLTNREIAEPLYLSERMAQNHVQHILSRLALPNRSQTTVWMTGRMSSKPE